MRRLRPADWLVLWSALFAAASLSVYWFQTDAPRLPPGYVGYAPLDTHATGWSALGWAAVALMLATCALGLVLVGQLATGARDAVNLPPAVFLAAIAPLTLLVAVIDTAATAGGRTTVETGAWVGLASLAALTLGAWLSLKDERMDQPSRQVAPPPALPAPPAG